jgi:hypothetical protein
VGGNRVLFGYVMLEKGLVGLGLGGFQEMLW